MQEKLVLGKVDKRTAQALISISHSNEWGVVEEWLKNGMSSIQHQMSIESDEVLTRWNQGAIQVLREFFDKKAQARNIIEKL